MRRLLITKLLVSSSLCAQDYFSASRETPVAASMSELLSIFNPLGSGKVLKVSKITFGSATSSSMDVWIIKTDPAGACQRIVQPKHNTLDISKVSVASVKSQCAIKGVKDEPPFDGPLYQFHTLERLLLTDVEIPPCKGISIRADDASGLTNFNVFWREESIP